MKHILWIGAVVCIAATAYWAVEKRQATPLPISRSTLTKQQQDAAIRRRAVARQRIQNALQDLEDTKNITEDDLRRYFREEDENEQAFFDRNANDDDSPYERYAR